MTGPAPQFSRPSPGKARATPAMHPQPDMFSATRPVTAEPVRKRMPRQTVRRGRGTLSIIAALLIASGLLRLVLMPNEAFAVGDTTEGATNDTAAQQMFCDSGDTPASLMEALRAREDRIVTRETQIADRMQALRLAEAEIEEKLVALAEAEASLEALLTIASSAAENDLDRLTTVYENMKPQDAAALFTQMEPAFSAGFMGRMNPTSAAAIMTNLEPERAYLISVVLAGRNATVPTE